MQSQLPIEDAGSQIHQIRKNSSQKTDEQYPSRFFLREHENKEEQDQTDNDIQSRGNGVLMRNQIKQAMQHNSHGETNDRNG